MPAAVLSYEFWQRRFDGDPAAVGRTVTVHGTKFAITGVMPREFSGLRVDTAPAMWVPRRVNRLIRRSMSKMLLRWSKAWLWIRWSAGYRFCGIVLATRSRC
jgi:hypothetical protein